MAGKGINTAKNYDDELDQDQDQEGQLQSHHLKSIAGGKMDAQTALTEDKDFKAIYMDARKQLMKNGTTLSEEERKAFEEKLLIASDKRDPKKLEAIRKNITTTVDETHKLTAAYFGELERHKDLFGKDTSKNVDTLEEYKQAFKKQELKSKKEWSTKLQDEIKSLKTIREDLIRTVGEGKEAEAYMDQFNKLRRHEKREYLKEIKDLVKQFTEVAETFKKSGLYSPEELKHMTTRFREAPIDKQKKMLAEYQEDAKSDSIKTVQQTFKKFSPKMQQKHEETLKKARGLKAKKEVISGMKGELRETLIKLWQNSKFQSQKEKSFIVSSIEKEENPEMLEMFIKSFGKVEDTIKGFAKSYEKTPPNVQAQYDFWNSDYSEKERISKECTEHMDKIGKWNKKLDDTVNKRHISSISAEKYRIQFEKLSLRDKDAALKSSTLDDPRRAKTLQRFENQNKIPKETQDQHKQFYNMRLEDRIKLVDELEGTIDKKAQLQVDWTKKLENMVEDRLLSPESVEAYEKEFDELETTEEMKEMLGKSDLEDPRRKKVLETFDKLPDATKKKWEQKFYNQDLTDRIETLKQVLPDGGLQLELSLSSMDAAKKLTDNLEQETELKAYREMAETFDKAHNRKAEIEIREKILKLKPDDEANQERLEELRMMENPDSQFVGEMLSVVRAQPGMQEELMKNKILFEIADRAHSHEVHSKIQGMEGRAAANDNTEMGNVSGQIFAYTDGEQMLDKRTGKARDVQIWDERDFQASNVAQLQEHRHMFKADGQDIVNTPGNLGHYGVRDKTGKEMKGEELVKYKMEKATRLAEVILFKGSKGQIKGRPTPEVVAEVLKAMDEGDGLELAA